MNRWIFSAIFVTAVGLASGPKFDPVTMDPPVVDPNFPPSSEAFRLVSGGEPINAQLLLAGGAGLHATVVVLHGRPGNERNFDVAQVLRRAGYHVLTFNYRGSWGSGGNYSFANCVEDARSAVAFLRTDEARAKYRVDAGRIALFGHSAGGYAALAAAAREPSVRAVAALAPMNESVMAARVLTAEGRQAIRDRMLADMDPRAGPLRAESPLAIVAQKAGYDFLAEIGVLRARPVLLIAGTRDTVLPIAQHHEPIVKAVSHADGGNVATLILDDDHSFNTHRIGVARAVLEWLEKTMAP